MFNNNFYYSVCYDVGLAKILQNGVISLILKHFFVFFSLFYYNRFMFKNLLLKKMLRSQGVPEAQIDMVIKMMEKNPQLFKTIASEIQAKVKSGIDQMTASAEVMKKYESELKKLV